MEKAYFDYAQYPCFDYAQQPGRIEGEKTKERTNRAAMGRFSTEEQS